MRNSSGQAALRGGASAASAALAMLSAASRESCGDAASPSAIVWIHRFAGNLAGLSRAACAILGKVAAASDAAVSAGAVGVLSDAQRAEAIPVVLQTMRDHVSHVGLQRTAGAAVVALIGDSDDRRKAAHRAVAAQAPATPSALGSGGRAQSPPGTAADAPLLVPEEGKEPQAAASAPH